jgi:hypothetical protein
MKTVAKKRGRKPRRRSKKFLLSNFTSLVCRILYLVDAGFRPKFIASALHISKQRLNYWLNKLKREKLIEHKGWGTYYLTDLGRLLLSKNKKHLTGSEDSGGFEGARLHHVSFKFPVFGCPRVPAGWRRVCIRNLVKYVGRVGEVTVEMIVVARSGVPVSLIVYPSPRVDRDPYRALLRAYDEALMVARVLEERLGMRLGVPEINRKPHFAFPDPVIKKVAKHVEISSDIGKIDQSEGQGELEYFSPEKAAEYLAMPDRLRRIEENLNQLTSIVEKISSLFEKLILPMTMKNQQKGGPGYVT